MFLINTRRRNTDKSFGHERIPKGEYHVYEASRVSNGKEARQRAFKDIPTDKEVLLLVHGFNNDFERVLGAYLGFEKKVHQAGFKGRVIGFTWPSYGAWFQYFGDRDQVEYGAFGFLNFLLKFRPLLGSHRFHVNTHSMGAHLVVQALATYSRLEAIPEFQTEAFIVDELTFFAADVSNEILEKGEDGRHAADEASRVTSYFSSQDPILGLSRFVNRDGRLGLDGAERPSRLPKNAFQIDCSTLIESHSGYRDDSDVMQDFAATLNGEPSDEIEDRRPTGDKNTFRIGPEVDED